MSRRPDLWRPAHHKQGIADGPMKSLLTRRLAPTFDKHRRRASTVQIDRVGASEREEPLGHLPMAQPDGPQGLPPFGHHEKDLPLTVSDDGAGRAGRCLGSL